MNVLDLGCFAISFNANPSHCVRVRIMVTRCRSSDFFHEPLPCKEGEVLLLVRVSLSETIPYVGIFVSDHYQWDLANLFYK